MSGKVIEINYTPQDYQREVHNSKARFKVVVRGRRGGKTEEEIQGGIRDCIEIPGLHWITGPTFRQIKSIVWTRLKAILRSSGDLNSWKVNEQELYVEHKHIKDDKGVNTRLELKGVDKEDSLVGVGLKSLRCDEAALYRKNVWQLILRPMLLDYKAPAFFYTTPRGKNWLFDLWKKGQDENDPDWESWRQPSSINKYLPPEELNTMKDEMSDRLYRQEVLAEFLSDETGVFRGIRQCAVGKYESPVEGRFYIIGLDIAKYQDFTVLRVYDTIKRHCVYYERFNQIDWKEQKVKIKSAAHRYNNALVVMDATGVGDPFMEELQDDGVSVEGIRIISNMVKCKLIENAVIAIERRLVTFPYEEDVMDEYSCFEYQLSRRGNVIYSAPEGKHDDIVIADALALWRLRDYMKTAQVLQEQEMQYIQDKQGQGERVIPEMEEEESIIGGY